MLHRVLGELTDSSIYGESCVGRNRLTVAIIVHRVCWMELTDSSCDGAFCVLGELTDISSYGALCVLGELTDSSSFGALCLLWRTD
jgi:hypothetical protein